VESYKYSNIPNLKGDTPIGADGPRAQLVVGGQRDFFQSVWASVAQICRLLQCRANNMTRIKRLRSGAFALSEEAGSHGDQRHLIVRVASNE